jgi:hypothetical protein
MLHALSDARYAWPLSFSALVNFAIAAMKGNLQNGLIASDGPAPRQNRHHDKKTTSETRSMKTDYQRHFAPAGTFALRFPTE